MAPYHPWIIVSGILGNILSFLVYLAPLPTFVRVYKKKSTEGFQSIPYVVALVSAVLWIYYATLKSNAYLLVTINSIGCVVETVYIIVFIVYAPKKARILTLKLLVLFNFGGLLLIFLLTHFFSKGTRRIHIVGWFCVVSSAGVFAAPLSIMRKVIKTKSVEYMPFTLSVFLTLGAVMWFFYGLLLKDMNIAVPNVLGFIFGILQMILYAIYKNHPKKMVEEDPKLQLSEHIVDVVKLGSMVCSEVNAVAPHPIDANNNGGLDITKDHDASNKV
ncbi:hypothetical protein DITRI_Ditri07aG0042300 [Diplodiscus trichospermus]